MSHEEKVDIDTLLNIRIGGDFAELEPALMGKQFRVIHTKDDVPIRVTYERQTSEETMCLRVLMSGDYSDPGEIRLEVTSESDLLFCYRMLCTEQTYISLSNEN